MDQFNTQNDQIVRLNKVPSIIPMPNITPQVMEVPFKPPAFLSAPEGRQMLQSIKLGGELNDKPSFKMNNIFNVVRNAQPSLRETVRQRDSKWEQDVVKKEWSGPASETSSLG